MRDDISGGTRLRAGFTGRTYEVRAVRDGRVYVRGLPPVSEAALRRDIEAGKVEVLG